MTTYTVTQSTSIVLINSYIPNTVVLLSSIINPGHVVGIRDTTGSSNLTTNPIIVSTTSGLTFYDGTSSIIINNPYGYLTFSSKDSNTWQLINNQGYINFLSNAYLSTLTSYYVYTQTNSTLQERVSSLNSDNINVSNNINFQGLTTINGSTIFQQSLQVLSSLNVTGSMNISSILQVWGSTIIQSSLTVKDNTYFNNNVSSLGNLIANNINVSVATIVVGANLSDYISVQTLKANQVIFGGPTVITGNISAGTLFVSTGLQFINSIVTNYISTGNNVYIKDLFTVGGNIFTSSIITNALTTQNLLVSSNITVNETVSSFGLTASSIYSQINTQIQSTINVNSLISTNNLLISQTGLSRLSNITVVSTTSVYSSINARGQLNFNNVNVSGPTIISNNVNATSVIGRIVSTTANLIIKNNLILQSTISTQQTIIGENIFLTSTASIRDNISSFNFNTNGSVNIGTSLTVGGNISTNILNIQTNNLLSISTLNINMLTATSTNIPILITNNQSIGKIIAGFNPSLIYQGQDLFVNNIAIVRSSLIQTNEGFYSSRLNTSTISFNYLSSLTVGSTIQLPKQQYNTFNTFSLFRQNVSANILNLQSITASTFNGSFSGDGNQLTGIVSLSENIIINTATISTSFTTYTFSKEITSERMFVENQNISTSLYISSQNIIIAVGLANTLSNCIETSIDASNWIPNSNIVFSQYGTAVKRSGNILNTTYVATGADVLSNKTIQLTTDGQTWTPATTGGFTYTLNTLFPSVTYSIGYDVAYNSNINTWVTLGADMGGTSNTLKYSTDGTNWLSGINTFKYGVHPISDVYSQIISNGIIFAAVGTDDYSNYYMKTSSDGITWTNFTLPGGPYTITMMGNTSNSLSSNGWSVFGLTSLGNNFNYLYNSDFTTGINSTGSGIQLFSKILYNGSYSLAILKNTETVYYSSDSINWSVRGTTGTGVKNQTIEWSQFTNKWLIGTTNTVQLNTIFYSVNGSSWLAITSGGFNQGITGFGKGYSFAASPNMIGVVGTSLDSNNSILKPAIINYFYNTQTGLPSTLSNVFNSQINAVAYKSTEDYPWVAVGDGLTSLKTIGRSVNFSTATSWLPATTGGFTVGYGVTYSPFSNIWIAVGQATQFNTIQYSADGANWFGTNNCPNLNSGYISYGIGAGTIGASNFYWVLGKDTSASNTILYNNSGVLNNWLSANTGGFSTRGTAIAVGTGGTNYIIATGVDLLSNKTIQTTTNGSNWSAVTTGGFSIGGYGIGYKSSDIFVAVGEDISANKTIQYTTNGVNWTPATTGGFTKAGYSVIWNTLNNVWIATGEDLNGLSNPTIKYSGDGLNWSNITTGGFVSVRTNGSAFGITAQSFNLIEKQANLEGCNITIYNRSSNLTYATNTIRLQSNNMTFNEMLSISLSSKQITIGSNQISNTDLTTVLKVNRIYASSIVFNNNSISLSDTIGISSIITSTLQSYQYNSYNYINTSTIAIGLDSYRQPSSQLPNFIKTIPSSLSLNNNMFITTTGVGIGTSSPTSILDIIGVVGTSTLITSNISTNSLQGKSLSNTYLNIFTSLISLTPLRTNTLQINPSSLSFNNSLTINISSQMIGYQTSNPLFGLDIRSLAVISSISSQQLILNSMYLSPQYF